MKRTLTSRWRHLAAGTAVVLVLLMAGLTQSGSAQPETRMSKKEMKELIVNAKSKEDHQKLASYYKQEADRLLAEAKEHEEMAEMYRKNPHPLEQKHPMAVGAGHCRYVAQRYRQAAAKTQTLAAFHEGLVKKAQ